MLAFKVTSRPSDRVIAYHASTAHAKIVEEEVSGVVIYCIEVQPVSSSGNVLSFPPGRTRQQQQQTLGWHVMSGSLASLKTRRAEELMHIKSLEAQTSSRSCGVEVMRGRCQIRKMSVGVEKSLFHIPTGRSQSPANGAAPAVTLTVRLIMQGKVPPRVAFALHWTFMKNQVAGSIPVGVDRFSGCENRMSYNYVTCQRSVGYLNKPRTASG
ncbi:hypothetical protein TNCV_3918381 [Trichonephila clavipes]|nr:hypothetical protein TNCV_3918381 [Trichonephila clavipes]